MTAKDEGHVGDSVTSCVKRATFGDPTLFQCDDSERHWVLARDEEDACAVVIETLYEGLTTDIGGLTAKPLSEALARELHVASDVVEPRRSLYEECERRPGRGYVAGSCW